MELKVIEASAWIDTFYDTNFLIVINRDFYIILYVKQRPMKTKNMQLLTSHQGVLEYAWRSYLSIKENI